MIDGTYEIEIDNPMVNKSGSAVLRTDGDAVFGEIDAPVVGKQRFEGQLESENAFSAEGSFRLFLIGKVKYVLRCEVEGDSIRIDIKSNRGDFAFAGERVS